MFQHQHEPDIPSNPVFVPATYVHGFCPVLHRVQLNIIPDVEQCARDFSPGKKEFRTSCRGSERGGRGPAPAGDAQSVLQESGHRECSGSGVLVRKQGDARLPEGGGENTQIGDLQDFSEGRV